MQTLNSMQDLMVMTLGDLLTAERRQIEMMPMLLKAAHSPELLEALKQHQEETQAHAERLEQIFQKMGQPPPRLPNPVLEAMIRRGQDVMQIGGDAAVKEAALVCEAQKFEHFEMAGYGTAAALAKQMGDHETAQLLARTLQEEKASDERLTRIAEAQSNPLAAQAG
jgi:ferritin-like metal-binding protein YciE